MNANEIVRTSNEIVRTSNAYNVTVQDLHNYVTRNLNVNVMYLEDGAWDIVNAKTWIVEMEKKYICLEEMKCRSMKTDVNGKTI